jgi:hypothetical protein
LGGRRQFDDTSSFSQDKPDVFIFLYRIGARHGMGLAPLQTINPMLRMPAGHSVRASHRADFRAVIAAAPLALVSDSD